MQFHQFLKIHGIMYKKAAEELNFNYEDIRRYALKIVIPRADRLQKIHIWTKGAVTANDFYDEGER